MKGERSLDWGNRKPVPTILAVIFGIVAFGFLVVGLWYNPSFQDLFSQKPQVKSVIGMMQTFDLPPKISFSEPATEYFGEALCNLTGVAFVVGSQVVVNVEVSLPSVMQNKLYFLEVKIDNAIMYQPFSSPNAIPYPCDIFMFPNNTEGTGTQLVTFETSGILSMTIKIGYEYPIGSSTTMNEYTTNVTVPNLQIGTGQEAQQQVNVNLNLSLTSFVLFFASVDITVALYDHSERKNRDTDHE